MFYRPVHRDANWAKGLREEAMGRERATETFNSDYWLYLLYRASRECATPYREIASTHELAPEAVARAIRLVSDSFLETAGVTVVLREFAQFISDAPRRQEEVLQRLLEIGREGSASRDEKRDLEKVRDDLKRNCDSFSRPSVPSRALIWALAVGMELGQLSATRKGPAPATPVEKSETRASRSRVRKDASKIATAVRQEQSKAKAIRHARFIERAMRSQEAEGAKASYGAAVKKSFDKFKGSKDELSERQIMRLVPNVWTPKKRPLRTPRKRRS